MEKDDQEHHQKQNIIMKRALLIFNCILLAIGNCGGPMIMRLYFVHGGNRIWLSSWLETLGFPVILIPLLILYFQRRRAAAAGSSVKKIFMTQRLFLAAAGIGFLFGFDDYLYAYGLAKLPVSTAALIIACQLAFTAGFAYLLVKQKFTSYSVNTIVLLTMGGAVLAMHTRGDRPAGESTKQYVTGFLMTVAAAVVYGFLLPLVELTYKKAQQEITYTLVLEIQFIISFMATAVCTVGMLINKDFQAIPREAAEFGLGESKYYIILACSAIIWQGFYLGAIGIIFSSSSLFSAIVIAVLLPVTEILAVIIFKEKFTSEKGFSLALNLWGFFTYFYGEFKHNKAEKLEKVDSPAATQLTNVV